MSVLRDVSAPRLRLDRNSDKAEVLWELDLSVLLQGFVRETRSARDAFEWTRRCCETREIAIFGLQNACDEDSCDWDGCDSGGCLLNIWGRAMGRLLLPNFIGLWSQT